MIIVVTNDDAACFPIPAKANCVDVNVEADFDIAWEYNTETTELTLCYFPY